MRALLVLALLLATALPMHAIAEVSLRSTERLIRSAERGVVDQRGWASDLLDVLRQHGLDRDKENICASVAVIDQESGFNANPAVPGLGKLSEAALREKLGNYPLVGAIALRFLESAPSPDDSFMQRIRNARTERDLDLVYRSLVAEGARKAGVEQVVNLGLFNSVIDSRNEISTAGSMQVSVRFALDEANRRRFLPMTLNDTYAVRDELYTRRGGMDYGVLRLLGYETGYSKKIHRFADYNAGRYASRNAAFQSVISALTGKELARDGDLLRYKNEQALEKASATEKAVRTILKNMNAEAIRADLLREKTADFVNTGTFIALRQIYRTRFGKDPPFAEFPDINLRSAKITRTMTTRSFAESVNRRYQSCMATPE